MLMKLPHKDFKWLTEQEITSLDVTEIDADGDVGLILEVSNKLNLFNLLTIVIVNKMKFSVS